jgi:RimK family alpha-L-glutamate ligase
MDEILKFAIVGPPTENTRDLVHAAKNAGHTAEVLALKDVRLETRENGLVASFGGKNILDFDVILFRGYNDHIYEAMLLASMLVRKGKTVIEESLAGKYTRGKMQQAYAFETAMVPHPKTSQAFTPESWSEIIKSMVFPIIAKPVFGRKGRGILKIDIAAKADKFFESNASEGYLVQEYFPIDNDYRVFIVGDEVVGGFRRDFFKGEYKSNIHGTPAEPVDVDDEMGKVALDAVRATGYEIAGVDLFRHDGKTYVIEVNVAPQWEKFKKVTGINPAEAIIRYAARKHLG